MKSSSALLALPLFVLAIVAIACSGITISVPTGVQISISSNTNLRTTVTGKVKSIDTTKDTLVLEVAGKEQTIALTADTKFTAAGKPVTRADAAKNIKGEVEVTTENKLGKDVAVEVKAK